MTHPQTNEKINPSLLNNTSIKISAPAKLNLYLKITGQRADGYHELVSLMVPVALFDELKISRAENGLDVVCKGRKLPTGQDNLVYRAALSFFKATGIKEGANIELIKNIPVSAGLGGGSSDAAATLTGLNRLWGNPLSKEELERLAFSLGADVPFFLLKKPAIARGIGEILQPLNNLPIFWYVIMSPRLAVSTSWAYKQIKLKLTEKEKKDIISNSENVTFNVPDMLSNDLEKVTLGKYSFLCQIKDSLIQLGALGALMTGSGPSLFGLFRSAKKAHKAGNFLSSYGGDVFIVKGLS
jgi:4-diphosphocytidyl-2-C-methyl-D-erythritol kinase